MMWMILSMMISIAFPVMKHPMSMGLILIMQTMITAMITGSMINMFWFSYILIITMLSGALVLFIYMASVASNEKFKNSAPLTITMISMLMISLITILLEDQLSSSKMWSSNKKSMFLNEQMPALMKLFNIHNMTITILIISYLLITMIVISYIVNVHEGPLRNKN